MAEITRRQFLRRSVEAALALGLGSSGVYATLSLGAPYPDPKLLVSPGWLRERYERVSSVRIVDARPPLEYRQGHIPNAINIWDGDFNVWNAGIPRQIAPPRQLADVLQRAGMAEKITTVVYDGDGRWAPRLFWALEYTGHPDVRVLDGGLPTWRGSGGPLSKRPAQMTRTSYEVQHHPDTIVDAQQLRDALTPPPNSTGSVRRQPFQIADGRPFSDYARGHISGAVSLPAGDLTDPSGRFSPAHTLRLQTERAGISLDRPTVVYGHTGLAAATVYIALRLLDANTVALYDGGWVEWRSLKGAPTSRLSDDAVSEHQAHRSTCW